MQNFPPLTRDLVLVGGGHSHALVLRSWGMNPLAGVRVTLINPGSTGPYTGMLPGFVAGHYTRAELDIDLVRLARFAGARLINGPATSIDRKNKTIRVGTRDIPYDVTSIDIGITSDMPHIKGFKRHGIPAKPLGVFSQKWDAFRNESQGTQTRIAVIGGGVAGVELAMAMIHALPGAKAVIIDSGTVLAGVGDRARARLMDQLRQMDIDWIEQATIAELTSDGVTLTDGTNVPSQFTVGAAGARPYDWIADTGLTLENGYIEVDEHLCSSDDAIYAVGDCAHLSHAPRPKAGVFAVREAPILLANLRADLSGGTRQAFHPQQDYLKLISLGGQSALAEKFDRVFSGPLLWKWKDRIDRTFMNKFIDLPDMVTKKPAITALGANPDQRMCGGCGAKVGRDALTNALSQLPDHGRRDVTLLAGDDAALLTIGGQNQVLTTDHLRAFTLDPYRMARIAAHHALGDIWAMGAAPQAATVNLILPRMSGEMQARYMDDIMSGVSEIMSDAGAAIVGGHSSLGAELTIGFSITGLLSRDPITLAGAQDGDCLLLTKPIGSGVIMAAEMQSRAAGDIAISALDMMDHSQANAAACLNNAHAMTDVTGFGLAGHLMGLCEASGLAATLDSDAIPVMDGALDLVGQGIRSSIWDDNAKISRAMTLEKTARTDLLFDPQTAGGLLAAVAADQVKDTLRDLRAAGYMAARIGTLTAGPPHITVR